jgi:hypothetical protein
LISLNILAELAEGMQHFKAGSSEKGFNIIPVADLSTLHTVH